MWKFLRNPVFANVPDLAFQGIKSRLSLFYLVSGVSLVIGTSLMGYIIKRYGVRTTYAFATNIIVALMINYVMRKFFIFKG